MSKDLPPHLLIANLGATPSMAREVTENVSDSGDSAAASHGNIASEIDSIVAELNHGDKTSQRESTLR